MNHCVKYVTIHNVPQYYYLLDTLVQYHQFLYRRAVNNEDNGVFQLSPPETMGLIVAPWKFNVLKTSIFALEASLLGQIFVLRTSSFCGAAISR